LFRYVYVNDAYTTQELIAGVENMQIMYGDGATFRVATDASLNWDNVTSVKIALLLRSEAELGTDTNTNTYNLLGTVVNPADLRVRRRVFQATAQIRNRT
jgi:type IV pilus assembly protein PilW